MRKTLFGRQAGCSALAIAMGLASAAPALAQASEQAILPPPAGQVEADPAEVADTAATSDDQAIVVTGTSIRGVAPVGSNLVTAGQAEIKAIAATNVTELTNTIPAITSAGSAPQGQNAYSGYAPSIHGIGGSSSNSTLVLVNGLRMPGGGTQYVQPDPNTIPTTALQRVEVITDGASSIYGSDAVSGVINYITRRTFDGVEVNGRVGFGDEYRSYDTSLIVGREWDRGGVYVAAQYTNQSAMLNTARPFTVLGDYRSIGGSNTNSFNCSPATIRTTAGGAGVFPSPSATATIPNNVTDNGFCNNSIYGNGIPGVERGNVLVSSVFEFGDRFTLRTMFNYDDNVARADGVPGQLSAVSVFGPGSPASRTAQINPFYLAPAGDPTATSETVTFVVLRPGDDYGDQIQESETFYGTSELEAELFSDWTGTLSLAVGRTNNTREGHNIFCSVCANLSVNGTTQINGSTTASSLPNQSAIVTNLPLTTSNALDVWRAVGTNRTSQSVLDYIYSNDEVLRHQNSFEQIKAVTQGSLFALPAGNLRVAAGAETMWIRQHITDQSAGLLGNTAVSSNVVDFTLRRNVYSAFGEAFIPVVSSEMEIPAVESFDLSLSLRFDHYNDFGSTTNPKIAATWEVIRGLKIRGNWGKSFVAPAMLQIGDPTRGFARGANGAGLSGALNVPVYLYPEVLQLPGCAGSTTTCRIGTGTNPGLTRSLGAGDNTKPQLGKSWSVGIDVTPELIPNFRASVTYWNTKFTGATSIPAVELILFSGALHNRLTLCPSGCTAAQISDFTQVSNGAPFNAVLPPATYFLMDRNLENLLNFDVSGIDAQADYRIQTGSLGSFTIGASVTYFTKYDQWFFDAPRFSILNTSGFNSQFPSIQTRGRAHLLWELEGLSVSAYLNFTGAYNNWLSTSVLPRTVDANGNPNGGGDRVKAATTSDLNVAYEFGKGGFLEGKRIYVDVKNLFDQDPAYYNGNTSGIGVGAWGYNGFVSNPLGRIVSIGFSADF